MRRHSKPFGLFLLVVFAFLESATAQIGKIDTLYYDSHWRRVSHPAFASYYRIYAPNDPTPGRKPFRDYYATGELQCEGGLHHHRSE